MCVCVLDILLQTHTHTLVHWLVANHPKMVPLIGAPCDCALNVNAPLLAAIDFLASTTTTTTTTAKIEFFSVNLVAEKNSLALAVVAADYLFTLKTHCFFTFVRRSFHQCSVFFLLFNHFAFLFIFLFSSLLVCLVLTKCWLAECTHLCCCCSQLIRAVMMMVMMRVMRVMLVMAVAIMIARKIVTNC